MPLILLLTWVLPWVCWPGTDNPYWEPKAIAWLFGCVVLLVYGLLSEAPLRPWRNKPVAYWTIWSVWLGVRFFWLPYLAHRTGDPIAYHVFIWIPTVNLLVGILTVRLLAGRYLTTLPAQARVIRTLVLSALVMAVYGLLQACGLDQWFTWVGDSSNHVYAGLGNPGTLGSVLAITLPCCLFFRERRYLVWMAVMIGCLGLTHARYAWGAAFIGLAVYGLLRCPRRWLGWVVASCVGAGLLVTPYAYAQLRADQRWPVWQETVYQWAHTRPITGNGWEAWRNRFQFSPQTLRPAFRATVTSTSGWHHPHSEPLKGLYDTGVIGMGLLSWSLWRIAQRVWRYRQHLVVCVAGASLTAWLVIACVFFSGHLAITVWWGLLLWALIETYPLEGIECQKA